MLLLRSIFSSSLTERVKMCIDCFCLLVYGSYPFELAVTQPSRTRSDVRRFDYESRKRTIIRLSLAYIYCTKTLLSMHRLLVF